MRSRTRSEGEYICALCLRHQEFWEGSIQPWVSHGSTFFPILNDPFHQDTENPQLSSLPKSRAGEELKKKSWKHSHGLCYLIYSGALRDTPPMHTYHIRWVSAHPPCTRTLEFSLWEDSDSEKQFHDLASTVWETARLSSSATSENIFFSWPLYCGVIRVKDRYAIRFLTLSGSISLENGPGQIWRKMS